MRVFNFALVFEQTLGHVTYSSNLKSCWSHDHLQTHWLEVPFELRPWERHIPFYKSNWSVRASLRTRSRLTSVNPRSMDALFFHTQLTSLFSIDLMRRVPTVISLDATPLNYKDTTPLNYDALATHYYNYQPRSDGLIERMKFWLNRTALQTAAALVPWTNWARRSLINDYGVDASRIHVIPPGVHIEQWATEPRTQHAGPVRILFVGGDFERKGGHLLLEAWRRHLRTSTELHIVTQSPVASEPGVYVYQGLKPNSLPLRELFASADIFALPTLGDTLGIVLAEAGAARLPAVSTWVAGIPEIVHHQESGLLCPPGDVDALAAAISQLVSDPDMRTAMGVQAGKIVETNFNAHKNAHRLLELLCECANERK